MSDATEFVSMAAGAHGPSLVAALALEKGRVDLLSLLLGMEIEWISEIPEPDLSKFLDLLSEAWRSPAEDHQWTEAELSILLRAVGGSHYKEEQFDLYLAQLGFASVDRDVSLSGKMSPKRVGIIGAGMSGILAATTLIDAGHDVSIYEKNSGLGGTWFNNTYPGCRVDVHNLSYAYASDFKKDWSENFSRQPEILSYFEMVAGERGIRERITLNADVVSAVYEEKTCRWTLGIEGEGRLFSEEFDIVVFAVGQLNRPNVPVIEGRESFCGPNFHSAEWDHDVDLTDKRVGVIGTGASAIQFVPEIAKSAAHLTVFQRSAPWLISTPDYHDPVPDRHRWMLLNVPRYADFYRFSVFVRSADSLYELAKRDPDWQGSRSVNALNESVRENLTAYLAAQCGQDVQLLEKLTPAYPPGSKRFLRDNGAWTETLKQPNVDLVTEGIGRICTNGVTTKDGALHELDVIIYGTGFKASEFLGTIDIRGQDGLSLDQFWDGDARAFLGLCVPGFPNMFCLYGPNTNIVANGSIIFFSECGVNLILESLLALEKRNASALAVRPTAFDKFNSDIDEANSRMAWAAPDVENWYKNKAGRVSQNWPFLLVDYWRATRELDFDTFEFLGRKSEEAVA